MHSLVACVAHFISLRLGFYHGHVQATHVVADSYKGACRVPNRQARAITGALPSTALGPLIKESGLRSAESLLNNRTRRFGSRLLSTPSRDPDGDTVINPASEMVRQSPLVTARRQVVLYICHGREAAGTI
jgi:hypothetical protein